MTVAEAAAYLQVDRTTVYRWINAEILEARVNTLDRRQRLLRREQVEALKRDGYRRPG